MFKNTIVNIGFVLFFISLTVGEHKKVSRHHGGPKKAQNVTVKFQVTFPNNEKPNPPTLKLTLPEPTTFGVDLLLAANKNLDPCYHSQWSLSNYGAFVTTVCGVAGGNGTYWALFVNNKYANLGVSCLKLRKAILISLSVLLWLFVLVIIYAIWKYIRLTKTRSKTMMGNDGSHSLTVNSFSKPWTYRTVQAQQEFTKYELTMSDVSISSDLEENRNFDKQTKEGSVKTRKIHLSRKSWNTSSETKKRERTLKSIKKAIDQDQDCKVHSMEDVPHIGSIVNKKLELTSLPSNYLNFSEKRNSLLTPNETKQQHIYNFIISNLNKQDRAYSPLPRNVPFEKSTHHLSLDDSFNGSNSDTSSICSLSGDEQFTDTSSHDGKRKRLATCRNTNRTTGKRLFRRSGRIVFTAEYFEDTKTLSFHLIRLYGLGGGRSPSEINPFVRLYLEPDKKQIQETKHHTATKEPNIDEIIKFQDIEIEKIYQYRAILKVYNHAKVKKNELLGEVNIALSSISTTAQDSFDVDLYAKQSRISLASVELSVCHHATFKKLEIIIENVRDLPGKASHLNPYVTVSLFQENSVVKKNTASKQNTTNPVFDEALDFDVITSLAEPLTVSYALVVTVKNRNLVKKNKVLGHVLFSSMSTRTKVTEFWKAIEYSPHKKLFGIFSLASPKEI